MKSARLAWAFLTRLPGGRHPAAGESMTAATPWFPVVGLVLGGLLGVAYRALTEITSPVISALTVVGLGAIATGGFHEDGLADTFDSAGGYTIERRLEIMRDSRIGTFGTLALVVATGLKVAALSQLDGPDGAVALMAAHSLGRGAALVVMAAGPEARTEGLAATSAGLRGRAIPTVVLACVVAATALGPPTAVAAGALALLAVASVWQARRWLGGTTGDVLGAVEQLAEIATLVVLAEIVAETGWLWV